MSNSTYNTKNGRYVLGGTTEVSTHAVEHWEPNKLERDPSDILYVVEKKFEGRPEMLGFLFYGDPGLWWVIAQYNGLIDPLDELIEGKLIYVPMIERVRSTMFNGSTAKGGAASTRNV